MRLAAEVEPETRKPRAARRLPTSLTEALLLALLAGCGRGTPATPGIAPKPNVNLPGAGVNATGPFRFVDLTSDSGIRFWYENGQDAGHASILESLGGGVALLDYDLDGDLDLVCPGGGEYGKVPQIDGLPPALFRQDAPWHFSDVAASARALSAPYYSHGAAAADFDDDGFADVLITGYGGLVLLRNQGDGTFLEVAATCGLTDNLWSSSAAWGDVNGDGALDLYVAHYVNWSFDNNEPCFGPEPGQGEVCPPRQFDPLPDILYFSDSSGWFRDVSREVELREDGKGLGVAMADVDLDGWIDIYVCNDTVRNFLYHNEGHGRLTEIGSRSGTALNQNGIPDGSMGVDVGDFNSDGLPDIWVANYENESCALYVNQGNCFFQHSSQRTGISALGGLFVSWGSAFCDFDADGDEDLVVSNGHVIRYPKNAPLRETPLLLENRQGQRYERAWGAGAYFDAEHMGRGLAIGDLDNDGDVDVVFTPTNEPVAVLSNESHQGRNWLGFRLIGRHSNRDAIGALLELQLAGGRKQYRQVKGGLSYASTNDRRVWFGVGEAGQVSAVSVRWPSGVSQTLTGLSLNRVHTVLEPAQEAPQAVAPDPAE
jgi:hypothetical protein